MSQKFTYLFSSWFLAIILFYRHLSLAYHRSDIIIMYSNISLSSSLVPRHSTAQCTRRRRTCITPPATTLYLHKGSKTSVPVAVRWRTVAEQVFEVSRHSTTPRGTPDLEFESRTRLQRTRNIFSRAQRRSRITQCPFRQPYSVRFTRATESVQPLTRWLLFLTGTPVITRRSISTFEFRISLTSLSLASYPFVSLWHLPSRHQVSLPFQNTRLMSTVHTCDGLS
jgi:hypothetical protein